MSNEITWQRKVIERFKSQGGYGRKQSHQYAAGVLDLFLAHPQTGVMVVECKFEKVHMSWKSRTIGFTEQQKTEAEKLRAAGVNVFGLTFFYFNPTKVMLVPSAIPMPKGKVIISHDDMWVEGIQWDAARLKIVETFDTWNERGYCWHV